MISNVRIPSGSNVSDPVSIDPNKVIAGVLLPTLDGTTFVVQILIDGTWYDMYSGYTGAILQAPVINGFLALDPALFYGARQIRFKTAANQTADRVLKVALARTV